MRDRELAEVQRRHAQYPEARPAPELRDRVVLVIDDGIATGATMRAALKAVKSAHPRSLVVAVPVGSSRAMAGLRDLADAVECLETPLLLGAIGAHYEHFDQLSDQEVSAILAAMPSPPGAEPDA